VTIDHAVMRGLDTARPCASRACLCLHAEVAFQAVLSRIALTGSRPPPCTPDDDPLFFSRWKNSARSSDQLPSAPYDTVCGSDVMQAMAQTNPANSRAIAVTTTCFSLPFAIM
jgi:hypothetical protein